MKRLLLVGLLMASPVLWLRGGLFQEPVMTALSAARLEFSSARWREVSDATEVVLKTKELDAYFRSYEASGWTHVDTMGSGYVFERGEEREIIVCRQYSTRYKICSILGRARSKNRRDEMGKPAGTT